MNMFGNTQLHALCYIKIILNYTHKVEARKAHLN